MVESFPYHWQKESMYHGQDEPYHYFMSINPMGFNDKPAINCSFTEEDQTLSINGIKFFAANLEEAGSIVKRIVDANNFDLESTIYNPTLENIVVEWANI